ncbi:MAG: hypothetical protein IKU07_06855 [Oscillospiraceae bacterium]|nr:hypothetical protein [Oscillospiraceae bacterium]
MTFSEIAAIVGVKTYPEAMEAYYDPQDKAPACDITLFEQLQKDYTMFGDYYDLVCEYAQKVNEDPVRSAWVKTAVAFCRAGDFAQAKSVPVPAFDGTLLTNMLPFYILAAQIPDSLAEYRRRGFREEELEDHYKVYRNSLAIVENHTGLPGTNSLYYGWDTHFIKAQIFEIGGLQYELRKLPQAAYYLKNKENGQVLPVMAAGTFHESGKQVLGSAGYTGEEGAFTCAFREDEENYYGYGCHDHVVAKTEEAFPKAQWEIALAPGEPCMGMHIPAGADISVAATNRSIELARALVKERYPEFTGRLVYCSSWLLDPGLTRLLGEESKISGFQRLYTRHPIKSSGMHVFGFVFPKNYGSFDKLPENTRLMRLLKQLYLGGGYNYAFAGVIF